MPEHVEVPVPEGEPKLWRCPKHGLLEPFRHSRGWGTGEPGEYGTCPIMEDEDTGCGQVMQPVPVSVPEEAEYEAAVAFTDTLNPHLGGEERQDEISALSSVGMPEALRAAAPFIAAKAVEPVTTSEVGGDPWPPAVSDGLTLPCADCGYVPSFDYRVSDDFWRLWVPDEPGRLGVVCLPCLNKRCAGQGLADAIEAICWPGTGHSVELVPRRIHNHARPAVPTQREQRDQAVQQEQERLKNVLPRLLDSYTADVIRHVEGAPGAGNDRARSQAKILAALDQEGDGDA